MTQVSRVTGLKKEDGTNDPALKFSTDVVRYTGLKNGVETTTEEFIIRQSDLEFRQEEINRRQAEVDEMQADLDAETTELTRLYGLAKGGAITL